MYWFMDITLYLLKSLGNSARGFACFKTSTYEFIGRDLRYIEKNSKKKRS